MSPTPTLLGLPYDASSSFLRGPAEAPPLIRKELWSEATNPWSEALIDLSAPGALADAGDLELPASPEARRSRRSSAAPSAWSPTQQAPAVDKAAIAAGLAAATAIAKAATGTAAGTAVVPAKAPLKYR